MFEANGAGTAPGGTGAAAATLDIEQLTTMLGALRQQVDDAVDDAKRVEQIRLLEEVKSAAAAAQVDATARFAVSQETAQRAGGMRSDQVGKGVAAQVGLAKRESPFRARRYVGWARILTDELPHTRDALRRGAITEWRAMIVARETVFLSAEHRAQVDAELAGRLGQWGDRQVEAETRRAAYRLDPHGFAERSRKKESERQVTLRPAPDTMSRLSALLPVKQGVAAYASLKQHADTLRAGGDERSRGQIMADALVERLTGQQSAPQVSVEVQVVITDTTLFGTDNGETAGGDDPDRRGAGVEEPAHVPGYGPVPAPLVRRWLRETDETTAVWLRRLYARPTTGELVAMESGRRLFEHGLRQFLIVRDEYCRTPWCGAPIRHVDHPIPAADGGPTSERNGQGLCEACNYAKTAPGWHARPGPGGAGQTVFTTTPTGHTYTSRPPDPLGAPPGAGTPLRSRIPPEVRTVLDAPSTLEQRLRDLISAA